MSRHRAGTIPDGNTAPVLSGRRRGLATVLVLLATCLFVGGFCINRMVEAPLWRITYNADPAVPRDIAAEMVKCIRPGQPDSNIPVIGQGFLRRVVQVIRDGRTGYAVDPFTGRVLKRLTALEQDEVRDCRYALDQYGSVPNRTMALTFDDGPSAKWTPQVLARLRAYHVHGTFFEIGSQIKARPAITRQVIADGDVVGNHTLNHHYIWTQSDTQARRELIETEHILATAADRTTKLFRSPFGGADPASMRADRRQILTAQQLGLTVVEFDIDTDDFRARPDSTLPLPDLSTGKGYVIVMHDGGGNRAATLRYVVSLIQLGEAHGYHFVTIPQLLPAGGGPAMTDVTPSLADWIGSDGYGAWERIWGGSLLQLLFLVSTGFMGGWTALTIAVGTGSAVKNRRRRRKDLTNNKPWWPESGVTILIAAYREAETITTTLESIFDYDYPGKLQVLVVANGSKKDKHATYKVVKRLAAGSRFSQPRKRLVVQNLRSAGKSRALNHGLFCQRGGRYIIQSGVTVMLDADTRLRPARMRRWDWRRNRVANPIVRLVQPLQDNRIGAVAGRVAVLGHGHNPWQAALTVFQRLSYDMGHLARQQQHALGGIVTVPGAFCAFRTAVLRDLRGVPSNCVAEDCDAGVEVRLRGCRVVQVLEAPAFTQIPTSLRALIRQQYRWFCGTVQVLWKHKVMIARPDLHYGLSLTMGYSVLSVLVSIVFLPLNYVLAGIAIATGNGQTVAIYALVFTGFQVALSMATQLALGEWSWNPLAAVFYRIPNDALTIYLAWKTALLVLLLGKPPDWEKTRVARRMEPSVRIPAETGPATPGDRTGRSPVSA